MDGASVALLRSQAAAAIRARGIAADCKVVVHKPTALARKRSLEAFNSTFGKGETVFDPTGAISRSVSIECCATALRKVLGDRLQGVFLDANRRALFIILDRGRFSTAAATMLDERVETMSQVAETVKAWRSSEPNSIDVAVRIGFEPPTGLGLIPVDRRSDHLTTRRRSFLDRLRKPGIAGTLASLVGVSGVASALAGDLASNGQSGASLASPADPAVAAPNVGVIGAGGWLNGNGFNNLGWGGAGLKATTPLGDRFGAQFDAAFGSDNYYGVGGHLFWRDSLGLLGVVGSFESMAGHSLSRVAVEGELYENAFTLGGQVGAQTGTTRGAFGGLDLTFYPTPNFSM